MQLLDDRHRSSLAWLFGAGDGDSPDHDEDAPDQDLAFEGAAEADEDGPDDGDDADTDALMALLAETDDTDDESDRNADFEWRDGNFLRESAVETFETDTRDERISDYAGGAPHDEIRAHVRERGLAEEMQEALSDLSTEEHESTGPEGQVLDMRNVIRRLAGDTTVDNYYRRPTVYPADDLAVGVSIDMSGSMGSDELEAKAAVGTFLFAVDQLGGSVVANAWQHQRQAIKVSMLTAPGERFRWEHLDAVSPGGGDPIARGMRYCGDLLRRTGPPDRLLFVVTDGKPGVTSLPDESFDSPIDEAAHVAGELRREGMLVIGVGFGSVNERNLEAMFGAEWSVYVPLEELADTLADELLTRVGGPEVIV